MMATDYIFHEVESEDGPLVKVKKILDGVVQSAYEVRCVAGVWRCSCPAGKFHRTCKHVHFLTRVNAGQGGAVSSELAEAVCQQLTSLLQDEVLDIEATYKGPGDLRVETLILEIVAPSYGQEKPPMTVIGFKGGLRVVMQVEYD